MKPINFNQIINRRHTRSVKWDFMGHYLQLDETELLPMWVSDSDFQAPSGVLRALHERVEHGVFGYSERDEVYYRSAISWFADRHALHLKREWFTSIEGVVPGMAILIQLLSKPGDAIAVQGPYYGSFAKIITLNGRELLENPLLADGQGYQLDFDQLDRCFAQRKPPLLLLCNPHNPTGRCWRRDELERLMAICALHNVMVISDEIWADLLLPGSTFTSILHLDETWHSRVISATSASKTFGLSSLRIANFIIPDADIRHAFVGRLNAHGLDVFNALSMTAAIAAYQQGGAWLDKLLSYLAQNRRWLCRALTRYVPWCKMSLAEGTYLAWLDCRALGLEDEGLRQKLVHEAKLAVSMGSGFGEQGKGFIRINLGCPRQYLERLVVGLAQLAPYASPPTLRNGKNRPRSRCQNLTPGTPPPLAELASKQDWHPADIVAAVKKSGLSLAELSRQCGLAPGTLANTLKRPWPKGEWIIAQQLGIAPEKIWPQRYTDRYGRPLVRGTGRKGVTRNKMPPEKKTS